MFSYSSLLSSVEAALFILLVVTSLWLVGASLWRRGLYFLTFARPRRIRLENLTETSDGYWFLDVYVDGVHQYLFIDPNYEKQWRSMPKGTILTDTIITTAANDLIIAHIAKKKGESSAYRTMFDSAPESDSHAIVKRGGK